MESFTLQPVSEEAAIAARDADLSEDSAIAQSAVMAMLCFGALL